MRSFLLLLLAAAPTAPVLALPSPASAAAANAQSTPAAPASAPRQGLTFEPDAGVVYRSGDFKLTAWGFAERAFDADGPDYFRRFRQGMEIDLPRLSDRLRPALVYEVDLVNTDAFGDFGRAGHLSRRNFENLFVALQDPDDPGKFRVLFGQNTHILSREDN